MARLQNDTLLALTARYTGARFLTGDSHFVTIRRHVRDLLRETLEIYGYSAYTAGSPREALRLAEEHAGRIGLLITDVVMPEMNGRDLADQLLIAHPTLKVLYVSGYTDDMISRHGVLEEGTNFLPKPFTGDALALKVRELLGTP